MWSLTSVWVRTWCVAKVHAVQVPSFVAHTHANSRWPTLGWRVRGLQWRGELGCCGHPHDRQTLARPSGATLGVSRSVVDVAWSQGTYGPCDEHLRLSAGCMRGRCWRTWRRPQYEGSRVMSPRASQLMAAWPSARPQEGAPLCGTLSVHVACAQATRRHFCATANTPRRHPTATSHVW